MANDCLVTKLKGVVNNPNLPVLGEIRTRLLNSTEDFGTLIIESVPNESVTVTISNGATAIVDGSVMSGSITIPAVSGGDGRVITRDPNNTIPFYISATNKYNGIKSISLTNSQAHGVLPEDIFPFMTSLQSVNIQGRSGYSPFDGNIECFKTLSALTSLEITYNGAAKGNLSSLSQMYGLTKLRLNGYSLLEGNVSALSGLTGLTELYLYGISKITGEISAFAPLINLEVLEMGSTIIGGSVEDFVSARIAVTGSQSGSLHFQTLFNGHVTFGGNIYTVEPVNEHNLVQYESASKIAVLVGTSKTSYHTVYCKGYGTQAQAESAFPGKTVIRVDA